MLPIHEPELATKVPSLSPEELDQLPYGAIKLDKEGYILSYNRYESVMAGIPKERALGKNFFRDVAPCTDVAEFAGKFKLGVIRKDLHEKFRYHFAFKNNPRDVLITLFYHDAQDVVWVFIHPLS